MKETKVMLIYPAMEILPKGQNMRTNGSLGPLYLAGALNQLGIEVKVLDMTVGEKDEPLESSFYNYKTLPHGNIRVGVSEEDLAKKIDAFRPTIIGVSSIFTEQTDMALEIAKIAKKINKDVILMAGGCNASALYEHFLNNDFDLISLGEGELFISHLIEHIREGKELQSIPGIAFKLDNKICTNKHYGRIENLDALPMPLWDAVPLEKYWQVNTPHYGAHAAGKFWWQIETSRGCKFHCVYCVSSHFKKSFLKKSIERVVKEIVELKKRGIEEIIFEDDYIGCRDIEFWKGLENLNVDFYLPNGININSLIENKNVNKELIDAMRRCGVKHLGIPFESGSSRILKKWSSAKWNPEETGHEALKELCKYASEAGITLDGYFMIGFPDETLEEAQQTRELAKSLRDCGLSSATFFLCTPFPGAPLWNYVKKHNLLLPGIKYRDIRVGRPVMKTAIPAEDLIKFRQEWYRQINDPSYVEKRTSLDIQK